jgi:putative DNA primase/helicase
MTEPTEPTDPKQERRSEALRRAIDAANLATGGAGFDFDDLGRCAPDADAYDAVCEATCALIEGRPSPLGTSVMTNPSDNVPPCEEVIIDDDEHIAQLIDGGSTTPPPAPPPSDSADGERPPAFSDIAIADRFAAKHAPRLRYCAAWGKWLEWDHGRWRPDATLNVRNLVKLVCKEVASECAKPKIKVAIASAKTVAAVERLVQADRALAATTEQWDTDLFALNTPAGIVDLRSGEVRASDPLAYCTKMTGVAPDGRCSIEVWLAFLKRVTGGDESLVEFLRRMVGYALTGSTEEHALFFLYGTGANGKSTFMNAIAGCLGDYHRTAPIETFTATNHDSHPTDVAGLRGARLVSATETEEGRRWAEAKIKKLTGGEPIPARFMRQDFFEYVPQFKLFIAGNHKPGLRAVDEAIRRRFNLVPYTVTIPPDERDSGLADKLKDEWPGILAWAIDGCIDWLERGLAPPQAVTAATAEYLEGEDSLSAWLQEAGERDPTAFEESTALFGAWKAWATRAGEWVGSQRKFSQRLEDRADVIGMRKARDPKTDRNGFYGLRLARADEEPAAAGGENDTVPL